MCFYFSPTLWLSSRPNYQTFFLTHLCTGCPAPPIVCFPGSSQEWCLGKTAIPLFQICYSFLFFLKLNLLKWLCSPPGSAHGPPLSLWFLSSRSLSPTHAVHHTRLRLARDAVSLAAAWTNHCKHHSLTQHTLNILHFQRSEVWCGFTLEVLGENLCLCLSSGSWPPSSSFTPSDIAFLCPVLPCHMSLFCFFPASRFCFIGDFWLHWASHSTPK